MEVGAVKQAFNNELILLKQKFNQAKIQIIHKLTRRAKTFAEKKGPDGVREKFKKKAESAVNEVLIIKKIKPKDLAKFAITHKENLNSYLNKPIVDQDKACARLLLHKTLQEKYKLFRTCFSSIPIKDLFMSREERKKLKKEAREKQKNNKKEKDNAKQVVNSEGNWDVEDIETSQKTKIVKDDSDNNASDMEKDIPDDEDEHNNISKSDDSLADEEEESSDNIQNDSGDESDVSQNNDHKVLNITRSDNNSDNQIVSSVDRLKNISGKFVKTIKIDNESKIKDVGKKVKPVETKKQDSELPAKKVSNKNKQSKNKNLNEKLLSRKFKKGATEDIIQETNKIVDPFFITSTGESYMSIVEPRGPDEVKEVHKQGNRKLRRAAMFGHVPKIKPRCDKFRTEDNRFNNMQNGFDRNNKFNDINNFNDGKDFSDKRNQFNRLQKDPKPEKLHPSWEAKKKQSGILPFQGKKIVFNES